MRLALTLIMFAATTQFPSGISQADEKPNFSGTWKVAADLPAKPRRSGPRLAGLGSGWGVRFTISQTPELLEVERDLRLDMQPKIIFRYSLTGDQRTNTLLIGHGTHSEVSTARWEGNELMITTIQSVRHQESGENIRYEVKHVLSLEPPQADAISPVLVIETTRDGVLGGAASNTRTVFHKE